MKKIVFVVFIALLVASLMGCATTRVATPAPLPAAPEAIRVTVMERSIPAPASPEPVTVTPAVTPIVISAERERAEALADAYGRLVDEGWNPRIAILRGEGKEVTVSGPGGTETFTISDSLLGKLKSGEGSFWLLACEDQAVKARRILGPVAEAVPAPVVQAPAPPPMAAQIPPLAGCQDAAFAKGGFWKNVAPGIIAEVKVKSDHWKVSQWSVDGGSMVNPMDCYRSSAPPTPADFATKWGGQWILERSFGPGGDGGRIQTIAIYRKTS